MHNLPRLFVLLVVLGTTACATGPAAPPAIDVTGEWKGTWEFEPAHLGSGTVVARFKQDGAKVTGELAVTGPSHRSRPTRFNGTVSGDDLRMLGPDVTGWLKVKGNEMTGEVYGIFLAKVTMRRGQ